MQNRSDATPAAPALNAPAANVGRIEHPDHSAYAKPGHAERSTGTSGTRGFSVIGHRGAAGHAPENTFAAFDRGLALGVDGVETDLRVTSDGVLVLLHDATVDRTTDGTGEVATLTWEELQALDAGARFPGASQAPQRIPTLNAFLDRYGGRTTFRLEIKAPGVELAALRAVRARNLMEAVVFTSFQMEPLVALRVAAPEAQLAYLSGRQTFDQVAIQAALDVGANEIAPRAALVTRALVEQATQAGLRVWAWGVKDIATLRHAVQQGIGGCTLDYPDWANEINS